METVMEPTAEEVVTLETEGLENMTKGELRQLLLDAWQEVLEDSPDPQTPNAVLKSYRMPFLTRWQLAVLAKLGGGGENYTSMIVRATEHYFNYQMRQLEFMGAFDGETDIDVSQLFRDAFQDVV